MLAVQIGKKSWWRKTGKLFDANLFAQRVRLCWLVIERKIGEWVRFDYLAVDLSVLSSVLGGDGGLMTSLIKESQQKVAAATAAAAKNGDFD